MVWCVSGATRPGVGVGGSGCATNCSVGQPEQACNLSPGLKPRSRKEIGRRAQLNKPWSIAGARLHARLRARQQRRCA